MSKAPPIATVNVIVTDFGTVTCGPKFDKAMRALSGDLSLSRRFKRRRAADEKMRAIEECCFTLSEIYWQSGTTLTVTP